MRKCIKQRKIELLFLCLIFISSPLQPAAGQESPPATDPQVSVPTTSEASGSDDSSSPTQNLPDTDSEAATDTEQDASAVVLPDEAHDDADAVSATATSNPAEDSTPKESSGEPSSSQASSASSSWTDNITVKGDLRYRVELIGQEDTEFRYRHRIRARVGAVADVMQELQATVQVGTGGSDDPVSNNQTLTESFSSKPLWLDLAYFDWHPSYFYNAHITGGKMKNPFYKVGKSELLWDPDLNPEGMAITYEDTFGNFEPFLNTGIFWLQERKSDDDSWLFGGQAGVRVHMFDDNFYVLVGGGYIDYMNLKGYPLLWDPEDPFGNSSDPNEDSDDDGELDADLRYRYDYDLINGFVEIGGKIVGLPWAAFSDFVVNTQADDDKTGWLAGVSLGKAKEAFDFDFRYIYKEVRSDATVGILTDSDFLGGGTDGKGHEFNFSLQLSKGAKTAITYFYNQKGIDDSIDFHRAQFDIKMKF